MFLVDVMQQRCVLINTGIIEVSCVLVPSDAADQMFSLSVKHMSDPSHDGFLVSDQSILLVSERNHDTFVYLYNNIHDILDRFSTPLADFEWSETAGTYLPPDASKLLPFATESQVEGQVDWYTVHPWNTPNSYTRGFLPVTSTSEHTMWPDHGQLRPTVKRYVSQMWLDPVALVDHVRDRDGAPIVLNRTIHQVDLPVSKAPDGQEMIVPGYCGTNFVWITPPRGALLGRIWWMPLPLVTDQRSTDRIRVPSAVELSADLGEVDALDLCEEMGLVALAPRVVGEGVEECIKLLYF